MIFVGAIGHVSGRAELVERPPGREDAPEQSGELYRLLAENANDLIYLLDLDGRIVYASPSMDRVLGRDPGRLGDVPMASRYHPEDIEAARRAWTRILAGEKVSIIYRSLHQDNSWRWFETSASLVEYRGKSHVMGVCRDVTERKLADDALKESQWKLGEAQRVAHVGHWERDLDTGEITWSDETYRIFGRCPHERIVGLHALLELIYPDDRQKMLDAIAEAMAGRARYDIELRIIRPGGEVRVVHSRGDVSYNSAGRPRRMFGTVQDISDRKDADRALRESEQRYREVFNCTSDCIFLLDVTPEGRFKFADLNPAEERAVGYSNAEVKGKLLDDAVPEPLAGQVLANFRRCVEVGTMISYDEELDLPVGRRSFHTNLIPVRNDSGRVHRIVGVARDVTGSKRAEEQLRASLREKEVLLKEVHHRVKNNLQLIDSLLALQTAQIKDRTIARAFAGCRSRLRAMALVHENLYHPLSPDTVRIDGHIASLCAYLYHSYDVDPARIELDVRVVDVELDLDRSTRCGLILNELVSNAIKHAFPGGRSGRIEVRFDALPRGCYALVVTDDGIGLPPGVEPSRSDSLGLQLVGDLTEQLNGTLTVKRGGGTMFSLHFPTIR